MISSLASHSVAAVEVASAGLSWVRCSLSPFMRRSAVIRDDHVGQLDLSRVFIAADPDGGKLTAGAIVCCYRRV
jgi:hypothetical protein